MAIAHVTGQSSGNVAPNTTSVSEAFNNDVTAGNNLYVVGFKYSPSNDALAEGDLTKTAGTATLGTITLDVSVNFAYNADANHIAIGIWRIPVTGSGSLTLQLGGAVAGSYLGIAVDEFEGDWDSSSLEDTSSNTDAASNTTPGTTGNVTSAGAALFIAGITIGTGTTVTITPDGAFTETFEEEAGATNQPGSMIWKIVGSGNTDQGEWTLSGSGTWSEGWAGVAAVYKEAAAPPPEPTATVFLLVA